MNTMKTWIVVLLTGLFAVHAYGDDGYEVQKPSQLLVEVKGVVCSFCAYGTEKNLARLEFIDQKYFGGDGVLLDLKKASIALALQKDQKINFINLGKVIKKGGYVPIAIHLKLVGPVVKQNEEFFVQNQWNGQLFHLVTAEGQPWSGENYLGKEVMIQGVIPQSSLEEQIDSEVLAVRIKQIEKETGFTPHEITVEKPAAKSEGNFKSGDTP
jgi:hypothetical protein